TAPGPRRPGPRNCSPARESPRRFPPSPGRRTRGSPTVPASLTAPTGAGTTSTGSSAKRGARSGRSPEAPRSAGRADAPDPPGRLLLSRGGGLPSAGARRRLAPLPRAASGRDFAGDRRPHELAEGRPAGAVADRARLGVLGFRGGGRSALHARPAGGPAGGGLPGSGERESGLPQGPGRGLFRSAG